MTLGDVIDNVIMLIIVGESCDGQLGKIEYEYF